MRRAAGAVLLLLVGLSPAASAHPPYYVRLEPVPAPGCTGAVTDTQTCAATLTTDVLPIPEPGTPAVAGLKHWGWTVHLFRQGQIAEVRLRVLTADGRPLDHKVALLTDRTRATEGQHFALVEVSEPFRVLIGAHYTLELRCFPLPSAGAVASQCSASAWLYYHQ